MKTIHIVAWVLVMIGGINWLLIGLGGFIGMDLNVVHLILGSIPVLEWLVYVLVGISTVYEIVTHKKNCMMCSATMNKPITPASM